MRAEDGVVNNRGVESTLPADSVTLAPPTPAAPTPRAPGRIPAWVVDATAVALTVAFTFAPVPGSEFRPDNPLGYAAALAAAPLLLLRRRWPIPALAGLVGLYALAAFTGVLSLGNGVAIGFGVYNVANSMPRRQGVVPVAFTAVAVAGLSVYAARDTGFDPRIFQFAVSVALAAALGDAARSRREYIQAITERAVRAEQTREAEAQRRVVEERLRIARDLHDTVAHQIAVISLNAGVASATLETRPEKARAALTLIREAARTVLGETADLLNVLRAGEDGASDPAAPPPDLADVDDLANDFMAAGMRVTVRKQGDLESVSKSVGLVTYRVLQEALTNAHKHGSGARAHVSLHADEDALHLSVFNPATGEQRSVSASTGHGLIGVQERVTAARGTVETRPVAGGFELIATLPLTKTLPPTEKE